MLKQRLSIKLVAFLSILKKYDDCGLFLSRGKDYNIASRICSNKKKK